LIRIAGQEHLAHPGASAKIAEEIGPPALRGSMKNWSLQEASEHFTELLEACLRKGPQSVTMDGVEAAVLVPIREWRRLQQSPQLTLKELLLTDDARASMSLPVRGKSRRRPPRAHA